MIASRFYFCGIIIMWLSCRKDVWLLRWNKHPYVVFCCVVNILTVSTADHNQKLYFWHPKAQVVESSLGQYTDSISYFTRVDSRLAPSQWETSLRSNAKVSHWLGTNLYSALFFALSQQWQMCLWPCSSEPLYRPGWWKQDTMQPYEMVTYLCYDCFGQTNAEINNTIIVVH